MASFLPMRIAILSHWHTGSSLLAHQLRMCGMEVGNESTHWDSDCEAQCEHSKLNAIGDLIWNSSLQVDLVDLEKRIKIILESYVEEGRKRNWSHYGVKVTHALQHPCSDFFLPAFYSVWGPKTRYIVITRRPKAIICSTAGDNKWDNISVMESVESTYKTIGYLLYNRPTFKLVYPVSWRNGDVKRLVEMLGLKWIEEANDMFDLKRVRREDWFVI